jgi:predicted phage replisome organizer
MAEQKYYWLKLKRDFFKRHDIQIIESMPNGKDYVLFYLKLLAESIDHEGMLRFNDMIPYSEQMLSTITNTNVDIVRSAISLLKQLDLVDIMDDQTLFVKDTQKMLGESSTERVRRFRERKSQGLLSCNVSETVTVTQNVTELELEKEIERDIVEFPIPRRCFVKPTVAEIQTYCAERNNSIVAEQFFDYNEARGWMLGKGKMKDWKAAVRTWESRSKQTCQSGSGVTETSKGVFKI